MADESQYYQGQLRIVNKLIKDVENRKQILNSFLTAYKKQIDHAYADKMMMETISELRNVGFPKYESLVKKSITQLDRLHEHLQRAKKSLQRAIERSPKL